MSSEPDKAAELHRQAELLREAASMRTTGGHGTNKLLRDVADRLTRKAAKIE